ncbi:hypothetical protein [Rubrobacter aplysinae]|uniref:hypothetical protein n=1 Tax=Rubrobacter aplysinae TaxID=909625 RepID=UPI00064BA9B6|nr:hypothetical protein [Rubrobacter aplysinae]
MKKVVVLIVIGLVIVPWPWLGSPLIAPYLRGWMTPEEIRFMAPIILAYSVYLLIGIMALIILVPRAFTSKKRAKTRAKKKVASGHSYLAAPPVDASRRKREKRKKRAQAGGDIAMALMLIDDNKKN